MSGTTNGRSSTRRLVSLVLTAVVVGSVLVSGSAVAQTQTPMGPSAGNDTGMDGDHGAATDHGAAEAGDHGDEYGPSGTGMNASDGGNATGANATDMNATGGNATAGDASAVAAGNVTAGGNATNVSNGTARVRVLHASADAPPVDVYVDGELAEANLSFGTLTNYTNISAGEHNVTITAANDTNTTLFQETIPVPAGTYTVAAAGSVQPGAERAFTPLILLDQAHAPEPGNALVRLAHLSPDAPTVDVTVEETGDVLFNNVSYGNATAYESVPAGNYTLQIRRATAGNNGPVGATVNVSVEPGMAYTGYAIGYVSPQNGTEQQPFQVLVSREQFAIGNATGNATGANATGGPMAPANATGANATAGNATAGNATGMNDSAGNATETNGSGANASDTNVSAGAAGENASSGAAMGDNESGGAADE
ncbi:MAG: DUF4397 domain-containing protein [Haloarculaceae archaeon]